MPPLPPPEGMHVLVVHFPIALLFVAPLFVLLGAVTGLRSMMVSALILMVLGVAGAFAATTTGELAMDYMDDFDVEGDAYDLAYETLDKHEEQAEYSRNLFTGLTLLYAGVVLLTTFSKTLAKFIPRVLINLVFLGLWAYPVMQLASAAHEGGRLVHEFGLQSVLAETMEEIDDEEDQEDEPVVDDDETPDSDETTDNGAVTEETPAEAEADLEAAPAE